MRRDARDPSYTVAHAAVRGRARPGLDALVVPTLSGRTVAARQRAPPDRADLRALTRAARPCAAAALMWGVRAASMRRHEITEDAHRRRRPPRDRARLVQARPARRHHRRPAERPSGHDLRCSRSSSSDLYGRAMSSRLVVLAAALSLSRHAAFAQSARPRRSSSSCRASPRAPAACTVDARRSAPAPTASRASSPPRRCRCPKAPSSTLRLSHAVPRPQDQLNASRAAPRTPARRPPRSARPPLRPSSATTPPRSSSAGRLELRERAARRARLNDTPAYYITGTIKANAVDRSTWATAESAQRPRHEGEAQGRQRGHEAQARLRMPKTCPKGKWAASEAPTPSRAASADAEDDRPV